MKKPATINNNPNFDLTSYKRCDNDITEWKVHTVWPGISGVVNLTITWIITEVQQGNPQNIYTALMMSLSIG